MVMVSADVLDVDILVFEGMHLNRYLILVIGPSEL